ncbi:MAG: DUF2262 domain-containing protein [Propionibacteriaceae bacterium]|nr:DUF2262 domain-containing protein [Propionibacteriaceae bacterium]
MSMKPTTDHTVNIHWDYSSWVETNNSSTVWKDYDLSKDWREDGPFDISEVDLEHDEVNRLDLGALIVTPEPEFTLKLVAAPHSSQEVGLVVDHRQSSLQVSVCAAPSSGEYCTTMRDEIISNSQDAHRIELGKGPFGTEIRRIMAVANPQGKQDFAPVRDWLIAGPRWVVNVRFLGEAAVDIGGVGAAADLIEFVRNMVVRRGGEAMMPGAVIPLAVGGTPGD